ncbi:uncharacterized protein BYT42DRAFT_550981 [Radiomyces spectabilis]|uniref:uncharacterized protein n=1 Tax=Radiomyces spectabilis TaxID=64574 RepID=UPI00221F1E93|nr:uncharacterized protein BYT42DRAFT_550981 [Radiomyces spectabilis]KAI8393424.1 hypothetical protein BYT42DRAFT_550981 [Radiomyces spectabilis]
MSQSQDSATQLFTTFIGIISECKALVTALDTLRVNLVAMNCKLDELNTRLEVASPNEKSQALPLYQHVGSESSPFAYMPIRRTIQHRQYGSGAPRKWSWELFKILGCDVLKERWDDSLLTTFKKNVKVFTKRLVWDLRSRHSLPATATWSDLPSPIQNEAVLLLEGGVGVDFPLKACAGNWGARLLMVHAFQKCKVKEAVEPEEGDARYVIMRYMSLMFYELMKSYFNGFYRIHASAEGRYVLLRVFLYR